MKKIMMLGAGGCQLNAIKRINELGYISIVSDNLEDSPGKKIASLKVMADTFSFEETYKESLKNNIDGIMTSGTDQPVLIVNKVAKEMNLPMFLGEDVALNVTNKKNMKQIFSINNIPTTNYVICSEDFKDEDLCLLKSPYVIKPVDSQGQKGIFKVKSIKEIRKHFKNVLSFSREKEILIEEYYENLEVTVSGWVDSNNVIILTITDRVTFHSDEHIGVCISHEYPSIHLDKYREDFFNITKKICNVFKINEGPIYFQYLVGNDGVLVNEIACRIGGAFEDETIPLITDVDILKMNIEGTINKKYNKEKLKKYKYSEDTICISTQLFFCDSGNISYITPKEEILNLDCVMGIGYNYKKNDYIPEIQNASQRAGYVIITGKNEEIIKKNIKLVFSKLEILDKDKNLVKAGKRWFR